jgi:hypothetical protein
MGLILMIEQNVRRFQIAVEDAAVVSVLDRRGNGAH